MKKFLMVCLLLAGCAARPISYPSYPLASNIVVPPECSWIEFQDLNHPGTTLRGLICSKCLKCPMQMPKGMKCYHAAPFLKVGMPQECPLLEYDEPVRH
jgi:hypothetical protein